MAKRKREDFLKELNPFSFGLPGSTILFLLLLAISIIFGIAATALLNHNSINTSLYYILANGSLTGIIVIMMPALLTVVMVKAFKRYINMKYIMFVSIVGTLSYSVFILLSAIAYIVSRNYSIAEVIILVGDASLFGWWFFASKMLMEKKRREMVFALAQPTLNVLLYFPYSYKIISFATPFNVLVLKLYAGILIFLLISYLIIYVVDRPYRKSFGFHSFDAFTQLLQNWLFNVNAAAPFGSKFGKPQDILTDTITFRNRSGIKAVIFAPDIHYGPAGGIGGSDFPHLLQRHAEQRYGAPAFIMHRAVDMDHNPVSSAQFGQVRRAMDEGVAKGRPLSGGLSYTVSSNGSACVSRLGIGGLSLVTLTRAPRVTEDVSPSISLLFNELIEARFGKSILLDAHNSRLESAPKDELGGVRFGSPYAEEYKRAIRGLGKPQHRSRLIRVGVSSSELYHAMGEPSDLARGNMGVLVFIFNGFKRAIVHINANNMLPSLREGIVRHLRERYGIDAEVYTTDTHAVNSLGFEANNVVGRQTNHARLIRAIDGNVDAALADAERVSACHGRVLMRRFMVWGPNSMESIITIAKSVYGLTRVLVPLLVVFGFIIAGWVISVV